VLRGLIGEIEQLCAGHRFSAQESATNINPAPIEEKARFICTELHKLPNHFTNMLEYLERGGT
jgi:hypothetical protein